MAHKKWIIADADKEKASELSEKFNIDPFIAFLLVSRGVNNELAVSDFLSSSCEFSDPFNFVDMDKAVARIETAIDYGEKITIYGDYDCDGVTSTALLLSFLKSMGADVDYYIPSRETEGYGMNINAIDKICESGTKLIITVDNGIASVNEADYLYSLGMELVVTDHHQIPDKLPKAEAIINPHRKENNMKFRDFCGVGVAFKLVCAIYGDTEDMLYQYADLVAIGTIADVMPLMNENRGLVKRGLELINSNSRLGLEELKKVACDSERVLTSTDVAFMICPRINAAGRIDHASKAVELLVSEDYSDASLKAEQLNINNSHRQEIETEIFENIKEQVQKDPSLVQDRVIVIAGNNYHHGVVGIVASRVLEEYGKPVIIIGIDDEGNARGSARSIEGFNIFEAISYCSDLLLQYGGHPRAAGMGLLSENIDAFRAKINEYALKYHPVMPMETFNIDCKLSPFYLDLNLVDSLKILEPYGESNPQAIFALVGLTLLSVTPIGEGKHIRFECEKKGKKLRIVKFKTTAEDFPYKVGDKIDVAVKISKNLFKEKYYLSIQAVDVRRNGIDDDKYFSEKSIYELFNLGKNNDVSVFANRDICSVVYKTLKSNSGWDYSIDDLYFLLNGVTYGQLQFAIKAFEESGLISLENNKIKVLDVKSKVDLMNTPSMKSLKGRLNIG